MEREAHYRLDVFPGTVSVNWNCIVIIWWCVRVTVELNKDGKSSLRVLSNGTWLKTKSAAERYRFKLEANRKARTLSVSKTEFEELQGWSCNNMWRKNMKSSIFHLLEVLIEESIHDWIGADRGHGKEVARGVDRQQHSVTHRRVPAEKRISWETLLFLFVPFFIPHKSQPVSRHLGLKMLLPGFKIIYLDWK